MCRPEFAGAGESTEAADRAALEADSPLAMKPNAGENWVGPASRRRDNIGAPAMETLIRTNTSINVQRKQGGT